jgi:hypothetical protein
VQHHPSRAALLARLSALLPAAEAIHDPDPSGPPEAWRTYAECLRSIGRASHVLVLQDDVIPHPDLAVVLDRVVEARAASLISLYHGWLPSLGARAVRRAGEAGERWAMLPNTTWCPAMALIWPAPLAEAMLTWAQDRRGADDGLIGQWCRQAGQHAWCTIPNLVEHPDEPSLVSRSQRGGNPQRMSFCQPEHDCSILDLHWSCTEWPRRVS